MDRQTLSNYGWIVIAVLVLSVMIALATPFGQFIKLGAESTLFGLIGTSDNALGIITGNNSNDNNSGGGEQTEPTIPNDALIFNEGELIPVDGIYIQGYIDENDNWVETNYLVGNGIDVYFPKIQTEDVFIYENYVYVYLNYDEQVYPDFPEERTIGWELFINDYDLPVGNKICTIVNGQPVKYMYATFESYELLTIPPEIPVTVVYMDRAFVDCTTLTTMPNIPNGVQMLTETFAGCTSLMNVTEIPESVISMNGTFNNCTSLQTAPAIPKNVMYANETFYQCSSLKGELKVNSDKLTAENMYAFLAGTANEIYIGGNSNVSTRKMISELNDEFVGTECIHYLSDEIIPVGGIYKLDDNHDEIVGDGTKKFVLPMKSRTTFEYGDYIYYYNVNVTAASGYKSFYENFNAEKQYWAVDTKEHKATYGDMLDSIAGKNVEDLEGLFYRNFAVTTMPKLSKNAKILDSFCEQAKSLTDAGVLPEGVVSMYDAFNEATALKKAPIIPSSVKYMGSTFYNCSSLESFPVIPENVETLQYCFTFCKSIKGNLTINTDKIMDANSVKGALAVTNTQEVTVSCANEQIKNWILATLTDK